MKRILSLLFCALAALTGLHAGQFGVCHLLTEQNVDPIGIDTEHPRFSWQLMAEARGTTQVAYQIMVADRRDAIEANDANMWDSGRVQSPTQLLVPYNGLKLKPATTYYWKVRAWDNHEQASPWSPVATFTTGLPHEKDWGKAKWIALEKDDTLLTPYIHAPLVPATLRQRGLGQYKLPQFRRVVEVKPQLSEALLYVCGLGHFELTINGQKVGDHFLDPGWTHYGTEAQYVGFRVTRHLQQGSNVLGVMLGNGFYNIPLERYIKIVGSHGAPKMRLRLLLRYDNGTQEEVSTDSQWRVTASPITFSSIYGGENYDARLEQPGWNSRAAFNHQDWQPALEVKQPLRLVPQIGTHLAVRQVLPTVSWMKNGKGSYTYDLGQNFSGIFRIRVKGKRGQSITLRPAELLNPDTTNNQSATGAPHYYTYTLRGDAEEEVWQPRFTFYGFRYVQVEGAVPAGEPNQKDLPLLVNLEGLHTCAAAPEAGTFHCSNPMYNRIHSLIDWAIRSNMHSVMTDCPHREKLGWQEQNHLMQHSLMYRYNLSSLYPKLMNDMEASQWPNGCMPTIAPEYVRFEMDSGFEDTPEWGSSSIICPWYVWLAYGDDSLIRHHYPAMKRYMEYLSSRAQGHILGYGLGDWFDLGPAAPGVAQLTSVAASATAIYHYDATLMARMATLMGKKSDAKHFGQLADQIKAAYIARFRNADGTYDRNSQTANAMTLYMGLCPQEERSTVLQYLLHDIRQRQYALTAGDVGYHYLVRALAQAGEHQTLYRMNSKYDVPGYGWQLAHGATSLTESWQAYGFVSNNHFMLGHLMEWLYSGVGGISPAPEAVAWREAIIDPQPVGDIRSARTTYASPYGLIRCEWEVTPQAYSLRVEIPAGSTAIVVLPTDQEATLTESGTPIAQAPAVALLDKTPGRSRWRVGSGTYHFQLPLAP